MKTVRRASVLACALLVGAGATPAGAAPAGGAPTAQPSGYWLGDADAQPPVALAGATVIHARALARLLARIPAVLIDVSTAPLPPPGLAPGAAWLPLPHRALPGALWIPGAGMGVLTPQLDGFYRDQLARVTAGNRDMPVVVYCHERCWLSWNAAKRALAYGYRQVYWFADGVEGWTHAHEPTVVAEPLAPAAAVQDAAAPLVPAATVPEGAASRAAGRALPGLVVLDLELSGDLGGPELVAQHAARLQLESNRLRADLERTGRYRIIDAAPAQATLNRLRSQQAYLYDCNGCDLDVGRELNADLVMVAWVDRVSGLILTLTYEVHDVATGQIAARKSFDFRGDSDIAWNHAIDYMVRDLQSEKESE